MSVDEISVNGQNRTGRIQHLIRKVMAASPRPLQGGYRFATHVLAAALAIFYVYTAGFGVFSAESHRALFLAGTQVLVFLWFPARDASPRARFSLLDGLLALAAAFTAVYFIWEYPTMVRRAGLATPADVTLGALAIFLSLEAARRVVGPVVPLVAVAALLFAWRELAPYLPGAIAHRGFTAERMVTSVYMSIEGLFGVVTYTFATHVFLFVIFGAFLERSGVGRFFIELPYALMGRSPGGAGKVAVAASALLGSVTGSPTANTAAMGTFTIPLMKRAGYASPVAAGIETAASIGSQFLPPVMGAAAFFMVEFTGIPYIEVVKIAAIPALIYYVGVMAMVHFQARRDRMQGAQAADLPDWRRVLGDGWYLALPLVVLLAQLARGHSTGVAAFWGILTALVVSWIRPGSRMGPAQIWAALVDGTRNTLMIASVAGSIGIIVGIIGLTGLGLRFSGIMLSLTGESLFLAMLIVALTATVLGCGAPITATYVILAVLVPPALATLGVSVEAAHLTLIWFSQLSSITPPVCLVVYAAAAIAQADPFRTAYHAMKFSAFLVLMPFLFVYTPLLGSDSLWMNVLVVATAAIAAITFAATLQGYFVHRNTLLETLLLAAGTVALFDGRPVVNAVGLVLVGGAYIRQRSAHVQDREAAVTVGTSR
ncbi:MAG TPA: TRAP transporter fused permease subunit [Longimicrobiales bacterium]|nr:TRAP transporter fused permease subunit [Longimicrobiales bacterium]